MNGKTEKSHRREHHFSKDSIKKINKLLKHLKDTNGRGLMRGTDLDVNAAFDSNHKSDHVLGKLMVCFIFHIYMSIFLAAIIRPIILLNFHHFVCISYHFYANDATFQFVSEHLNNCSSCIGCHMYFNSPPF